MKQDASKGDIGSSEILAKATAVSSNDVSCPQRLCNSLTTNLMASMQVIVIAGIIGVSIGLFYVGAPVVETVADSFPRGS